ncbi:probable ribosome-binding factor A, chloroplastic [Coffea arabica]|uniref:Probable ribosome-binding factor A, chloroplastic n=1 Tax=Coffea arabica TaxID=13443 RepID=A0ABM4WU88_COFAR
MQHLLIQKPPTITTCSTTTASSGRFTPSILSPMSTTKLPRPQQITPVSCRRCRIKCMANPRRLKMVANQIRREISDMLITDKVLQCAVLPEAALGADRYLSSLTTVSDVEVSADLQVVKVYVSVFGDERGKEVALTGLKSKAKYVRSELGRRMKLRLTPEIRFIEDESLEQGSRVIAILDRIKKENEEKEANGQGDDQCESSNQTEEDEEWEGDDDEGIIYVK